MQRNTIQREIVYKTVTSMHDHPSADTVYEAVHREYPGIARATVFRILRSLAEQGMVQRVCLSVSADRYDFTLTPHAHAVCRVCGKVTDAPDDGCDSMPGQCGDITVEHKDIVYRGICAACKSL